MSLSTWAWIVAGILGVLAGLAWGRRGAGRRGGRPGWVRRLLALGLLVVALASAGLGLLLRQYHWLLADVPAAELSLRQLGTQWYLGTLRIGDGPAREFELRGDEWQLDARVIRWTVPAQLGGVPPVYRFERLSGRYGDPKEELEATARSVHDLREGLDFWDFRQRFLSALPIADARWGSAAYLPMLDGARYTISLNPQGGLVARPADPATAALLRASGW